MQGWQVIPRLHAEEPGVVVCARNPNSERVGDPWAPWAPWSASSGKLVSYWSNERPCLEEKNKQKPTNQMTWMAAQDAM